MDLEINLDSYSLEELNIVFKNVDNEYCKTDSRTRCIQKIKRAFDEKLEKIIDYFTMENERLLKVFILYLFGCKVSSENLTEIKYALRKWGMCNEEGEIFTSLKNLFVDKYRGQYIVSNLPEYKDNGTYPLYLELILFTYDIYTGELRSEQIIQDFRKQIGKEYSDFIVNYLQKNKHIHLNPGNKQFDITNEYIYKLMQNDKANTLLEIRKFYDYIYDKSNYKNYIDDLFKLIRIQRDPNVWIDISNLGIINEEHIDLLKQLGLLSLYVEGERILISLTNIPFELLGYTLTEEKLECHNYYVEEENNIIVPYNNEIFKICSLLMNKKYKLMIRDILLIFSKSNL